MKRQDSRLAYLAVPLAAWLLFFVLLPVGMLFIYSFLSRGAYGNVEWVPTAANYIRIFDPLYLPIYAKSFRQAGSATLACFLIGFPTAYVMATMPRRWRHLLAMLMLLPFLANFIVRAYAIRVLLGPDGPLSQLLQALQIITTPLSLNDTPIAVWLGMVTNYLPFMVLPLYLALDRLDFSLLDAATDLGARGFSLFFRILLPLSLPGIISGSVLVFVPLLGEFMIPDILGGARSMQLGNLISEQFLKARHWPFGAALSILLLAIMAGLLSLEWLSALPKSRREQVRD